MKKSVIVISGGMGDIGQATAKRLAQDGHSVNLLYYKTDRSEVDTFLNSLESQSEHFAYQCDVTDYDAVATILETIEKQSGGIDVCIHAAVSPLIRRRISLIDHDDFKQQFQVTVFGALNFFQLAVTHMKKRGGGSLIGLTTSALNPEAPPTTMAGYMCAKHALRGILQEFYNDVSTNNINVNAVAPDFVDTKLHSDLPEQVITSMHSKKDAHVTTPLEVAEVLAYLCSPKANTMTGKTFIVGNREPQNL